MQPLTSVQLKKLEKLAKVGDIGIADVFSEASLVAYDTPAASNASSATQTAGQANVVFIEGLITPSANGTVIARFASEVGGSAIIAKAGSCVFYQQVI